MTVRVLFLTLGPEQVPSSRVRVYQYIPYLEKEGIKSRALTISAKRPVRTRGGQISRTNIMEVVFKLPCRALRFLYILALAPWYDVLFIQKALIPISAQKILRIFNDKIVFDLDDAIYRRQWGRASEARVRSFTHMLKISRCVVAANEHLAKIASAYNDHVRVVVSSVDVGRYRPRGKESVDDGVVIGWIGTPQNTVYLKLLYNVFKTLARRYPALRIELVGSAPVTIEGVDVVTKKWSLETELADLQNFDIGIMPLPDDEWAKGKAGYKLTQYMAMGIPCVASPVGVNKEVIQEGINGFLAATEDEWIKKLSLLIEDKELRWKMGSAGRRIAEEYYSAEVNILRLVEILREAPKVRPEIS